MLFDELKAESNPETDPVSVHPTEDTNTLASYPPETKPKALPSPIVSQNILEWIETQVQEWLVPHNLIQMSHLLTNCDGRSLFYLNKYIKNGPSQQILNLLQEDSRRQMKQSISLIKLSRLPSLMDRQEKT